MNFISEFITNILAPVAALTMLVFMGLFVVAGIVKRQEGVEIKKIILGAIISFVGVIIFGLIWFLW